MPQLLGVGSGLGESNPTSTQFTPKYGRDAFWDNEVRPPSVTTGLTELVNFFR